MVASEHRSKAAWLWARLFGTMITTVFVCLVGTLEHRRPFPKMCEDQELPRGLGIRTPRQAPRRCANRWPTVSRKPYLHPRDVSNSMSQSNCQLQAIPRRDRSLNGRAHRPCHSGLLMPLSRMLFLLQELQESGTVAMAVRSIEACLLFGVRLRHCRISCAAGLDSDFRGLS
jgi:hypothetical protein